jgi:hypothetical protein
MTLANAAFRGCHGDADCILFGQIFGVLLLIGTFWAIVLWIRIMVKP